MLKRVIKQLLTVFQRKESTLIERVVVPLAHWNGSISRLPCRIQYLIIHIESRIRRGIVSLLLSDLILRVAPPQSVLPLVAMAYKFLKFLVSSLDSRHLGLQIQTFSSFLIVKGLKFHDFLSCISPSIGIVSVLM
jgi:hypothetical protein